jgi:hypothetical protein
MFETFSDAFLGLVSLVAVTYIGTELVKHNRIMKDMIYILDGEDAKLTAELEELARVGLIVPYDEVATA